MGNDHHAVAAHHDGIAVSEPVDDGSGTFVVAHELRVVPERRTGAKVRT